MPTFTIAARGRTASAADFTYEMESLRDVDARLVVIDAATEAEFLAAVHDADALIGRGGGISTTVIDGLRQCKIIALDSVGTDHIDVAAATAKGIPVTNCPDIAIQEVAEHTAALILGAHRRLLLMDRFVRDNRWSDGRDALLKLPRLFGQTLGLLSFGNIPRTLAALMRPFGLHVLAYDPFVKETAMIECGVEPVSLTNLLRRSDIVSNHLPRTPATTSLIGEEQFRLMRPHAIFVNVGRGATVDEPAMVRALREGWIAHAALDVFAQEPPDPDNPLLKLKNVTLTAHVASASARVREASRRRVGREIALVLGGRRPMSCVNPSVLAGSGLLQWQP